MRRRLSFAAAGASTALLAGTLAVALPAHATQPPSAAGALTAAAHQPGGLQLIQTRTSLLGTHYWYRQLAAGYPVVDGLYARHVVRTNGKSETTVWDGRQPVGNLDATRPTIAAGAATKVALAVPRAANIPIGRPSLWVLPSGSATGNSHLVWAVHADDASGATTTYVSAVSGHALRTVKVSQEADGQGRFVTGQARVFDPNPVVKLQDENLKDQGDSNQAVPRRGYSLRPLSHLNSSHTLVGRWVRITTKPIASSPDDTYLYWRHNNKFEQVMAYYAADVEQSYLQSLGFSDVNAEAQKILTDRFAGDNSFYDPSIDRITLGSGGVDDAEDPEVAWHEYGHAIQDDQVPGFGRSEQAGAIGEGFGDYMAVTMSQGTTAGTKLTPTSCVMDWDSTSYTSGPKHCLRTTVSPKIYPDDLDGEVHDDGEIWSHALWDVNRSLGRDKATTIIIEAQFSFTPSIDMPSAAKLIVSTAKMLYGDSARATTRRAFVKRGIL